MGKIFPTKHELAVIYGWWTLGLSLSGFILWVICYILGMLFIYSIICPLMLIGSAYCACKMLYNERSVWVWWLFIFSLLCLAISLLPWFLPIVRV